MDEALGAPWSHEDEPVDGDQVVFGELLDGVPVGSSGVGIGVGGDIEVDRCFVVSCDVATLFPLRPNTQTSSPAVTLEPWPGSLGAMRPRCTLRSQSRQR